MKHAVTLLTCLFAVALALTPSPGCVPPQVEPIAHIPLEGAHLEASCTDCHGDSLANETPSTCAGCHEDDRPADHYPGDCADCHNLVDWSDAAIDHREFFPTPHEGVSACGDCHLSAGSGDFSTFSCTDCHEHRRSEMDDEHLGEVGGYVYQSAACLDCHPDGDD